MRELSSLQLVYWRALRSESSLEVGNATAIYPVAREMRFGNLLSLGRRASERASKRARRLIGWAPRGAQRKKAR